MPHYDIQMLEVGCVETFPADFYFDGAVKSGEFLRNPFSFTLLRGEGKNILIDCGINLTTPDRQAFFNAVPGSNGHGADEVLGTVGLKPEDIDAIILSHCHWDHISGLVYFPRSRIFVQREEVERWREVLLNPAYAPIFSAAILKDDLDVIAEAESEGRVTYLDGESDNLFPGIHIRVNKFGHSFAHQIILMETDSGVYIFAGDVCNRPENLLGTEDHTGYIPNVKFAVGGVLNTLNGYDRIMAWAGSDISRVLMTHDGKRRNRFPYVTSELGLDIFNINK
jgi:glyoxylase-like metal-dependent hydrolase (beta-lactamase superfamily II)